ncbi:MAG: GNAT family N-acetyltransferase [Thermomicrobiales bacterium]|nr:GNAT family N-acetyltransferase [Thermomicrobiales bacterium]
MAEIFRTARLRVRPWTASERDVAAAFAIYGEPEVQRYLFSGPADADIEVTRAWLTRFVAEADPTAATGSWAVELPGGGAAIGTAILKPVVMNGVEDIEVGFHLARSVWGRGYATELATALLSYAFSTLPVSRIISFAHPDNAASRRVLVKAGFRETGVGEFKDVPVVTYVVERG